MKVKDNPKGMWVFTDRDAYLGGAGEKIREVFNVKIKPNVIFGGKRCDRKGHWG